MARWNLEGAERKRGDVILRDFGFLYNFGQVITTMCTRTIKDEEMYVIVKQRLQSLEDGTAKLVDGDEVFAQIQSCYGFKA